MRQPAHVYSILSITIHHRAGKQFAEEGNIPAPLRRRICRWRPGARPPVSARPQASLRGEDPQHRWCSAMPHRRAVCGCKLLSSLRGGRGACSGPPCPACRPGASWSGRCRHGPSRRLCAARVRIRGLARWLARCAECGPDPPSVRGPRSRGADRLLSTGPATGQPGARRGRGGWRLRPGKRPYRPGYHEGMEDQFGALGLILNCVVPFF